MATGNPPATPSRCRRARSSKRTISARCYVVTPTTSPILKRLSSSAVLPIRGAMRTATLAPNPPRTHVLRIRDCPGVSCSTTGAASPVHRRAGQMFHIDSGVAAPHIETIGGRGEFIITFHQRTPRRLRPWRHLRSVTDASGQHLGLPLHLAKIHRYTTDHKLGRPNLRSWIPPFAYSTTRTSSTSKPRPAADTTTPRVSAIRH